MVPQGSARTTLLPSPPIDLEDLHPRNVISPLPAQDKGGFGNVFLRFTILYALLIFAIGTAPLWLSSFLAATPVVNAGVMAGFSLMWLLIAVCAVRNFQKLGLVPLPSPQALAAARSRKFKHIGK